MTLGGYAGLTQTTAAKAVEPNRVGASIGYNNAGPGEVGVGVEQLGHGPAWGILAATLALGAALFCALPISLQFRTNGPKSRKPERTPCGPND